MADETWAAMMATWDGAGVQTVQTQAAQLRLTKTTAELGWSPPATMVADELEYEQEHGKNLGLNAVAGGYVQPFPELLVDPDDASGAARFDAQFYRANVDPNERYVLSVKGTTRLRIPGGKTGFDNLYAAGDWTYNRVLNAGCVEAAVTSGMEAAQAISGYPRRIIGDSDSARG